MPNVKLILQARMSSSRLPGKMLLPVGGLPLIILCAKRVTRNNKYPLIVATSVDSSDDALIPVLEQHNIKYARGPLDDVLGRFIIAAEGMADNDLIVRLTGDNPVVDSDFIDELIAQHHKSGGKFTRSLSPFDGLPYGVSAEVIEVGLLRNLHNNGATDYEREHVTIHHTLKDEHHLFQSPLSGDLSYLRATVDTKEDYDRALKLFENEGGAIAAPWTYLVEILRKNNTAFRTPYKKKGLKAQSIFALGTAQLGLPYGIANTTGQPDAILAKDILDTAIVHGVTWIDTAAAYGSSETVLGQNLTPSQKQEIFINTKLAPTVDTAESAIQSVENSCRDLGLTSLPVLQLHRWSQYKTPAWPALLDLQEQGKIQLVGASIQSPEEGLEALKEPAIKFIQLPFNICDGRWNEFIIARKSRLDIHVQARSSLLQGVFTLPPEQWPLDHETARKTSHTLRNTAQKLGRKSVQDLCYAYVRSQDWIDSVVVGVETKAQLLQNLTLFNEPLLTNFVSPVAMTDEKFLNPALWPKRD